MFYFCTKRRFDLNNASKLYLDALTGIAYEDDNQTAKLTLMRGYDKLRLRIEITTGAINHDTRGAEKAVAPIIGS